MRGFGLFLKYVLRKSRQARLCGGKARSEEPGRKTGEDVGEGPQPARQRRRTAEAGKPGTVGLDSVPANAGFPERDQPGLRGARCVRASSGFRAKPRRAASAETPLPGPTAPGEGEEREKRISGAHAAHHHPGERMKGKHSVLAVNGGGEHLKASFGESVLGGSGPCSALRCTRPRAGRGRRTRCGRSSRRDGPGPGLQPWRGRRPS